MSVCDGKVDFEKECGPDSQCISSLTVVARPELRRSVDSLHCCTILLS